MVEKVLDLNKLWPTNMAVKPKKLTNDFPVHGRIQEQNGSSCFSSIVQK